MPLESLTSFWSSDHTADEQRVALAEQGQVALPLDPVLDPVDEAAPTTPVPATVEITEAAEEPQIEEAAAAALPPETEQPLTENTVPTTPHEPSPESFLQQQQEDTERDQPQTGAGSGSQEQEERTSPEATRQLAALPDTPARESEESEAPPPSQQLAALTPEPESTLDVPEIVPAKPAEDDSIAQRQQERVYTQKKQAARAELSRLNIPFQSSTFVKSAEQGETETVALFLAAGMRPQATDIRQLTPLQVAVWNGHASVVDALLQHEVSVDQANSNGLTPLMAAAWNGHTEIVRALLDHGADINATDSNGYTAITYAEEDRNDTILALLREAKEK